MKQIIAIILILGIGSMAMAADPLCMAERQAYQGQFDSLLILDHSADALLVEIFYANKFHFSGEDGKEIGVLYLEDPMRFEGNVEESAKMFFEYVIKYCKEDKKPDE
jgi:hypothetical protein